MFGLYNYLTNHKAEKITQHQRQQLIINKLSIEYPKCKDTLFQFTLGMNQLMIADGLKIMNTDIWSMTEICQESLKQREELLNQLENIINTQQICQQLPIITKTITKYI